mmetsp:Transcript_18408/g.40442  ORF Transcript_18408/g.40442 Transcript_18408/m.40442 type:complete len:130 (-) Transcript_18408:216-605(-)
MSWKDLFDDAKSVEIIQRVDRLQAMGICTSEQKFEIKIRTDEGDKIKWKAKEDSNCCTRNLCNPRIRAFDVKIKDDDDDTVFTLEKGLDLNCCGVFCLPEMRMFDDDKDKRIGTFRINCKCFPTISVDV